MIIFENGMDARCREPRRATVARFVVSPKDVQYCVIGTDYGHLHTSAGDVCIWRSYSGAYKAARLYQSIR